MENNPTTAQLAELKNLEEKVYEAGVYGGMVTSAAIDELQTLEQNMGC